MAPSARPANSCRAMRSRLRPAMSSPLFLIPPPCGEGGPAKPGRVGVATAEALLLWLPPPRPPLRSADPPRKGEGIPRRRGLRLMPKRLAAAQVLFIRLFGADDVEDIGFVLRIGRLRLDDQHRLHRLVIAFAVVL